MGNVRKAFRKTKLRPTRPAPDPGPGTFSAAPVVDSAGWATMGVTPPQGTIPAGTGLAAGAYSTQVDWKTTWPDGSLRFGIATFKPAATGSVALVAGTSASGTFTPTVPTASVALDLHGHAWTSLGSFTVSSGTANVEMNNNANDNILTGEVRLDDGTADDADALVDDTPALVGTWTSESAAKGIDPISRAAAGAGAAKATYTFTGLASGTYRALFRWTNRSDLATNTPFRLLDGATQRATGTVNQEARPSGTLAPYLNSCTATMPATVSSDPWLAGPNVREWRHVVTPLDDDTSVADPDLRVRFDVRVYSDGQARVDVTVENLLDVATAKVRYYDCAVTVAGSEVFAETARTHGWLTRWRKTFGVGLTEAGITPDFEPAYESNALHRYLSTVWTVVDSTAGTTYDILDRGGNAVDYMPEGGLKATIGPYPDWCAKYIRHKNPLQLPAVLKNGDLAGSWPFHILDAGGGQISIDDRPLYWFDFSSDPPYGPAGDGDWNYLIPDKSHQPAFAFVPYILTGDRYYADEMAFWADGDLLSTYTDMAYEDTRRGSLGKFHGLETRAFAWSLRQCIDCGTYLPDGRKEYYAEKAQNNLDSSDVYAANPAKLTPLGVAWDSYRGDGYRDPGQTRVWIAPWEHHYLVWAIDHAKRRGFIGGKSLTDPYNWFQVQNFVHPSFDPEYAGNYLWAVGPNATWQDKSTYYDDLADVWYNTQNPAPNPVLVGLNDNYGRMIWCCLQIAMIDGEPDADDAMTLLKTFITKADIQPAWALDYGLGV